MVALDKKLKNSFNAEVGLKKVTNKSVFYAVKQCLPQG